MSPGSPDGRAVTPAQKRAIVERLYYLWVGQPELRLGQLLMNTIDAENPNRLYSIEDEALLAHVEQWYLLRFGLRVSYTAEVLLSELRQAGGVLPERRLLKRLRKRGYDESIMRQALDFMQEEGEVSMTSPGVFGRSVRLVSSS